MLSRAYLLRSCRALVLCLGALLSPDLSAAEADRPTAKVEVNSNPKPPHAPNSVSALTLARDFVAAGKMDAARAAYQAVLNKLSASQEWPQALFELGELYYSSRQWRKAVDTWQTLAKSHPRDPLTPQALWLVVTTQSGPLNDRRAALKTVESIYQQYPRTESGEQARYAEAVIYLWNGEKLRARKSLGRYLSDYPVGKFSKASQTLLSKTQ